MAQARVLLDWEMLRKTLLWPDDAELVAVGMSWSHVISFVVESEAIPDGSSMVHAVYRDTSTPARFGTLDKAEFLGFQVPPGVSDATNE